jgi:AcrR family transcriptional regulator
MNDRSSNVVVEPSPTRTRILRVAGRLFAQKGYHGTSMRDLASALDLTQGSLYNHVAGKEELLFAIMDRIADEYVAGIETVLESGDPPSDKLRAVIRGHLQIAAENLQTSTVFLHEWKFLGDDHRAQIQEKRDRYERALRSVLAEGVDSGDFRPLDLKFTALMILSVLNWFYQWYSPKGPQSAEEIADRYLELFTYGVSER